MRAFPLFLLIFSHFLSAQDYQPFIQEESRWMVSWDLTSTLWDADYFYENVFGADTLINDTLYTVVWLNHYARNGEQGGFETILQPFEPGFQDELIGLVREDVATQQVYYRSESLGNGNEEILLYDFSLEVGDLIYDELIGSGPYQVTNLDTQLIQGAIRRVWTLDSGRIITEGIGSDLGPFEGITDLISGGVPHLYQFCNGPAMDCNVVVDGFVNDRRQHNISIFSFGIFSPNFSIKTFEYRFLDTLHLNGHVYFRPHLRQIEDAPAFEPLTNSAFRQDGQQVYFLDTYTGQEILAYDFSLEMGGVLEYPYPWQPDIVATLTVTEVDSIMLNNGELRKRLLLSIDSETWGFEDLTWIEGIGEIHYPFDPYYRIIPPIDGPEIDLQCFYQDYEIVDEADYVASAANDCYTYVVDNKEVAPETPLIIAPNPAENIIYWSKELPQHRLLLYTSLGQQCGNYTMDNNEVDISALPAGSYYYQVLDQQGINAARGQLIKL